MTNISKLTIQIKVKWWLKWYIILCYALRLEPSKKVVEKGFIFKGGKV